MKDEYKKTALGEIPVDWEVVKLGDMANVNLNSLSNNVDNNYSLYYIDLSSVKNGLFDLPIEKVLFSEAPSRARRIIKKGDVIMATVRPSLLGYGYVDFDSDEYICSTGFAVISNKENTDGKYIYQYLFSPQLQTQIEKLIVGSNYPAINSSDVKNLKFPQPPLPEQQKIAEILSTVDKKIDIIDQQISQTQELKKGLMQRLLTKGIGHTKFKDSPLGEIPENWKVVKIDNIADVTAGGTPSTKESQYWGGDIPWMNSGEINLRRIKSVEGRITEIGLNNSSTKLISKNSVLMALAGQGKTRGKVAINEIELCTNQSLATIYNFKDAYFEFIFQNLESRYQEIRKMSTGDGGRGGLNLKIIKSIKIALPTYSEQIKIASILSTIDNKLEVLQDKKDEHSKLKKGLMQVLLTGRVRVNT